jgi:hypothetical protein
MRRSGEQMTAARISSDARVPRRLLARIPAKLSRSGLVESEKVAAEGSVEAGEEALSYATCVVTIATGRGESILPREAGSFNFLKCRVA